MFFPLVKSDNFHNRLQHILQRLIYVVDCALDDLLVVLSKDFVLFKYHRTGPAAIVNCEVDDPLVCDSLRNVI